MRTYLSSVLGARPGRSVVAWKGSCQCLPCHGCANIPGVWHPGAWHVPLSAQTSPLCAQNRCCLPSSMHRAGSTGKARLVQAAASGSCQDPAGQAAAGVAAPQSGSPLRCSCCSGCAPGRSLVPSSAASSSSLVGFRASWLAWRHHSGSSGLGAVGVFMHFCRCTSL